MRCASTKAVLIFAVAIATGCVDNEYGPNPDTSQFPVVGMMRVHAGTTPITVNRLGRPSASVYVHRGDSIRIVAEFLAPSGEALPQLATGPYEMSVVPDRFDRIRFAADSNARFSGTISAHTVSIAAVDIVLREVTTGRVLWSSALTINVVD
jgi:hypothetical protein